MQCIKKERKKRCMNGTEQEERFRDCSASVSQLIGIICYPAPVIIGCSGSDHRVNEGIFLTTQAVRGQYLKANTAVSN